MRRPRKKPVRREHQLQMAVAHLLDIVLDPALTWWTSIDHGVGRLGKAEAGIRKARGVRAGIPDIIIMARLGEQHSGKQPAYPAIGCYPVIGIELKAGNGNASAVQVEVADRWWGLGYRIFIARSLEGVQKILEECHIPMRSRMTIFGKKRAA